VLGVIIIHAVLEKSMIKPIFKTRTLWGTRTIILLIFAMILLLIDSHSTVFAKLHQKAMAISIQLQSDIYQIEQPMVMIAKRFYMNQAIIHENNQLRQEKLQLQGQLQHLIAVQTENNILHTLLNRRYNHDRRTSIAEVMGLMITTSMQHLIINQGLADGVFQGQVVIDGYGIVGQVINVENHESVVMLLTDPKSRIPIIDKKRQLSGIVYGTGNAHQPLTLQNALSHVPIQPGDLLLSSGLGQRYPKYYPVGHISATQDQHRQLPTTAHIKPLAHLYHDDFVLLLWPKNSQIATHHE